MTLTFKFTQELADIDVYFMKDEHGDRMPFGGRENAHAFYPDEGGNIHFNADVQWTFNQPQGVVYTLPHTHTVHLLSNSLED